MKFENENWAQFKGEIWKREINVRDFIQHNYKPYSGDDTFLAASSEKTKKVWDKLTEMFKVEREKGVYDAETKLPQGIDTYGPGYIDKEHEVIVGLQTDAPLKRGIFPKGGIRMVENSLNAYGYELDPMTKEIFTKYRKTHNEGGGYSRPIRTRWLPPAVPLSLLACRMLTAGDVSLATTAACRCMER